METIRDQVKDACTLHGVSTETACNIADKLGLDGPAGDTVATPAELL
jgi:hypothetical protein